MILDGLFEKILYLRNIWKIREVRGYTINDKTKTCLARIHGPKYPVRLITISLFRSLCLNGQLGYCCGRHGNHLQLKCAKSREYFVHSKIMSSAKMP